ncbi:MAG TPA: ATP-binding protein, partial [Afifellaceae bacterium]|nr:ATP-binding protein [Afifellaceae bacterium]
MASFTWKIAGPANRFERIGRRLACWSQIAGGFGVDGENGLTGLVALVVLPAAFVASLSSSLPLAFPVALATINLSIAGKRRNVPCRAGVAELFLAVLLLLVAVYFTVLAVNGAAVAAALAGVALSFAFAALPPLLRLVMAENPGGGAAHSRDVEGLNRLIPDERLVIVERNGRIAALSGIVQREFAASGLGPGSDILHLIDIPDRPLLLNALDNAGRREQNLSLRLNAEHRPCGQGAARINLSLLAVDPDSIIVRLQDSPTRGSDRVQPGGDQPDRTSRPAGQQAELIAGEGACDLEDAVRFAIRLLAGDAERQGVRVSMEDRLDREVKPVLLVNCSARIARQIALNIIGNAIKFSHAGGPVTIQTGDDGENGLLCVRDEGIGIAEGERDALFSPHKR